MPSIGELSVIPDTQENREGVSEQSFSINGDVGLLDRFSAVQAKEAISDVDVLRVNLALVDRATNLSTSGCEDVIIMSLLWAIARSSA